MQRISECKAGEDKIFWNLIVSQDSTIEREATRIYDEICKEADNFFQYLQSQSAFPNEYHKTIDSACNPIGLGLPFVPEERLDDGKAIPMPKCMQLPQLHLPPEPITQSSCQNSVKLSSTLNDHGYGILSKIVYAAHHSSDVRGQYSEDRLLNELKRPEVLKAIGPNWEVLKSNQDAAFFINKMSKEAVIVPRGSLETVRDWLLCDFLGFNYMWDRRVNTIYDFARDDCVRLKKEGYDINGAGHSLGGAIAAALRNMLGFRETVSFNSPVLAFSSFWANEQNHAKGEVRAYRDSNDVVSKLRSPYVKPNSQISLETSSNSKDPALSLSDALSHGVHPLLGCISEAFHEGSLMKKAHSIDPILETLEDGVKFNHESTICDENGDFEIEMQKIEVFDSRGKSLLSETIAKINFEKANAAAAVAINEVLIQKAVSLVLVNKDHRPQFFQVVNAAATAGALAWTGQVTADLIFIPVLGDVAPASTLANTAVYVGYAALLGDERAMVRATFNGLASAALQHFTSLPLSAGRMTTVSNDRLLGDRSLKYFVLNDRDHLTCAVPINGTPLSFGIHFDTIQYTRELRDSTMLYGRAHEIGGHASIGGIVEASLGFRSGYEINTGKEVINGNVLTKTWNDKKFSGQLTLSINIAGAGSTFALLPAFKSTKREYSLEKRVDGKPFLSYEEPLKHLRQSNSPVLQNGLLFNSQSSGPMTQGNDTFSPTTVQKHDKSVRMYIGNAPPNSRYVNLHERLVEVVKKGGWWREITLSKSKTAYVTESFVAQETQSTETHGVIGNELYSQQSIIQLSETLVKKDGVVTSSEIKDTSETKTVFYTLEGGYGSYTNSYTEADGTEVSFSESKDHRIEQSFTSSSNRSLNWSSESSIGNDSVTRKGPVENVRKGATNQHTVEQRTTFKIETKRDGVDIALSEARKVRNGMQFDTDVLTETGKKNLIFGEISVSQDTIGREYKQETIGDKEISSSLGSEPSFCASAKTSIKMGLFLTSTEKSQSSTTVENGKFSTSQSSSKESRFNEGVHGAISVLVPTVLDKLLLLAYQLVDKLSDLYSGKKNVSEMGAVEETPEVIAMKRQHVWADTIDLCTYVSESYGLGVVTEMASMTKKLGDGVPFAIIIISFCIFIREGFGSASLEGGKSKLELSIIARENLQRRARFVSMSNKFFTVARSCGQLYLVCGEFAGSNLYIQGLSCLVNIFQKLVVGFLLDDCKFGEVNLRKAAWAIFPDVIASSCTALALSQGLFSFSVPNIVSFLGGSWIAGVIGTALAVAVLPTLCCCSLNRFVKWGYERLFSGGDARERFITLLSKYNIKSSDVATIKKEWHRLARLHHTDKGGDKEIFQMINSDFTDILELAEAFAKSKICISLQPLGITFGFIKAYINQAVKEMSISECYLTAKVFEIFRIVLVHFRASSVSEDLTTRAIKSLETIPSDLETVQENSFQEIEDEIQQICYKIRSESGLEGLKQGDVCIIKNLEDFADLNGKTCTVIEDEILESDTVYLIKIKVDQSIYTVRRENLQIKALAAKQVETPIDLQPSVENSDTPSAPNLHSDFTPFKEQQKSTTVDIRIRTFCRIIAYENGVANVMRADDDGKICWVKDIPIAWEVREMWMFESVPVQRQILKKGDMCTFTNIKDVNFKHLNGKTCIVTEDEIESPKVTVEILSTKKKFIVNKQSLLNGFAIRSCALFPEIKKPEKGEKVVMQNSYCPFVANNRNGSFYADRKICGDFETYTCHLSGDGDNRRLHFKSYHGRYMETRPQVGWWGHQNEESAKRLCYVDAESKSFEIQYYL